MRWLWQIGALGIMLAGGWLGMTTLRLPPVVPASGPDSTFSAERALSELRPITKAPHAVGSEEHQAVLMLLTDRLRALGFEVEIQGATGFNALSGAPTAAMVRNIVARRPGSHSTGTLLLLAHYDAAPRSLGAGDDGSGVATILETVRALAKDSLKNDLLVVFTDAEESGLLGAEAFANLHAFAGSVKMVLNFDSRGDRGPTYLFETSVGNAKIMRLAASAGTPLLANSFMAALYRLLPNDTDLSIFLHSSTSYAGLNFAILDGFQNYHSPTDDILHLDPRSLQMLGNYALPLTRVFGNSDLGELHSDDAIYFNAPWIGLIHYNQRWALPLAVLALLGVMLFAIAGKRSGLYGLHGGFWGLIAVAMMIVVPTALSYGAWRLVTTLHPGYRAILQGEPYNAPAYFLGFTILAITLGVAMQQMFVTRLRPLDLVVPTFIIWALLDLAAAIWLPGASFLMLWPLLAALTGAAWWLHGARRGLRRPIGAALCAVPVFYFFAPLIRIAEIGLTMSTVPVLVLLMMLVLSLAALPILLVGHTWRWVLPLGLVAGIWAVVSAELGAKFSPEQKRPDSLAYLLDADLGKAWWLSFDGESDLWTRQALGENPGKESFAAYHLPGGDSLVSAIAPGNGGSAARIEVVSSRKVAGGRRVHLHITATGRVDELRIRTDQRALRFADVSIDGRPLQNADSTTSRYAPRYQISLGGTLLRYVGMPTSGIDFEGTLSSEAPVSVQVMVIRSGLPPLAIGPLTPRPNQFISKPFIPTDVSIVTKAYRI